MKSKILSLGLVLVIALANSTASMARQANENDDDWAAVSAVPVGAKLSVKLKDGKKMDGTLSSVSDTTLTLARKNGTEDLDRTNISKVYRVVPHSMGKSIARSSAIGAAIGGGTGAFTGVALGGYEDIERAEVMVILGLVGAGIGAGIGALTGAIKGTRDKKELIYESK